MGGIFFYLHAIPLVGDDILPASSYNPFLAHMRIFTVKKNHIGPAVSGTLQFTRIDNHTVTSYVTLVN